jgi:hypothetical protein
MSVFAYRQVTIIGYESVANPFLQTSIDMMTQFLRERQMRLATFIWVHNVAEKDEDEDNHFADSLTLTDHAGYLKKIISNTDQLKGLHTDLMIIRCHGAARKNGQYAQLVFTDNNAHSKPSKGEYLVHSRQESPNISLKELTDETKLVLLFCCAGNQIMTDYLSERHTKKRPYILVSNQDKMLSASADIIQLVLMNIIECNESTIRQRFFSEFWTEFLVAIRKIFGVVKLFGDDHEAFWKYLQHLNVITLHEQRSKRHELPGNKPEETPGFQLYGRCFEYFLEEKTIQNTFRDFKSLLLVVPDGPPERPDTAADIELSADENVDVYLKSYKIEQEAKLRATPPPAERVRRLTTLEYDEVAHPAPVHDVPLDEMPVQSAFCAPSADILRMRACLCKGLSLKKASN